MKITKIEGNNVFIGTEDNRIVKVPITSLNYDDPQIGDVVKAYKSDNNTIIIARDESAKVVIEQMLESEIVQKPITEEPRRLTQEAAKQIPVQQTIMNVNEKRCNKHIFVWVCNFLFGYLGVDRFIRGQIGLGVVKLLTGGALGVWSLIDFIISLVKAYGSAYGGEEDVVFINGKYTI